MYAVDEKDNVIELDGVPRSSVGAPNPIVVGDECRVFLAYFVERHDPEWDGTTVRTVVPESADETVALIEFHGCYAHMFGPPNDEAFSGHPLASRGLKPYGVFRVDESSWVRRLEQMNSVHPYHRVAQFRDLRHFIFTFHDSTFECIASGFKSSTHSTNMPGMIRLIEDRLG